MVERRDRSMVVRALLNIRVLIRVSTRRVYERFCRKQFQRWEEVGMGLER